MNKSIYVNIVPLTSLVDIGSDAAIFNIDAYTKFGSPVFKKPLSGFGI